MTGNANERIEWRIDSGLVPYRAALEDMTARNAAIAAGTARELVWLLEHPPVYTAGTSAAVDELLDPRFEVVEAGRGGRYTYHGPGQRIGYAMLDLGARNRDVRCYVHALEGWVIATLGRLGIEAFRAPGRIGICTLDPGYSSPDQPGSREAIATPARPLAAAASWARSQPVGSRWSARISSLPRTS